MPDVVVIGGGVIGLSTALRLSQQGCAVRVLDQGAMGQEASWAGAGMLPPGNPATAGTLEAWLRGSSALEWPQWSALLAERTGIDIGYRRCGSVEVRPAADTAAIGAELTQWRAEGIAAEELSAADLRERFPAVAAESAIGYWMPDYAQVRNPRLLKALLTACLLERVQLSPGVAVQGWNLRDGRVEQVVTAQETVSADHFVLTAGAWSQGLLRPLGVDLQLAPVRGQIVLLNQWPLPLTCLVQSGLRYLVPRPDGRILIGATEEHAGFDKRSTAAGVTGLLEFGQRLIPTLKQAQFERAWAGLRPWRPGGLPFIGRAPAADNLVIAAGHFRAGLQLSPITATLVTNLVLNRRSQLPAALSDTLSELR